MAVPDDSFVDEKYRPPLFRFNSRWTGMVVGLMGFSSLGLAMSIVPSAMGLLDRLPLPRELPEGVKIALVAVVVLIHFGSLVGFVSTLIYGLQRTGDDAAVIIRGRRFSGLRLGAFYLACFGSPWMVYALLLGRFV